MKLKVDALTVTLIIFGVGTAVTAAMQLALA